MCYAYFPLNTLNIKKICIYSTTEINKNKVRSILKKNWLVFPASVNDYKCGLGSCFDMPKVSLIDCFCMINTRSTWSFQKKPPYSKEDTQSFECFSTDGVFLSKRSHKKVLNHCCVLIPSSNTGAQHKLNMEPSPHWQVLPFLREKKYNSTKKCWVSHYVSS